MNEIIIITGCTAVGKSRIADKIASKNNGVVINADSLQVYKECPILSAQPKKILDNHKLYSVINGDQSMSIGSWLELIEKELDTAIQEKKTPIITGGTAMYIRGLVNGIAKIPEIPSEILKEIEDQHEKHGLDFIKNKLIELDCEIGNKLQDKQRIIRALSVITHTGKSVKEFYDDKNNYLDILKKISNKSNIKIKKILLTEEKETLIKNCYNRLIDMLQNGAIEEVEQLISFNYNQKSTIFKTIGVEQIIKYINREISYKKMTEDIMIRNMQYIKKQNTWFNNKFKDFEVIKMSEANKLNQL